MRQAGDPEASIGDWVREGAPLGLDREIPCCGVFPPVETEETSNTIEDTEQFIDTNLDNYVSIKVDEQDAAIEVERVVARKVASRRVKADVKKRFRRGHNSRMAAIVKIKDDGSKKRRLIVDIKRPLANTTAKAPERVVLPRLGDSAWRVLRMMRYHLSGGWSDPGCHPLGYDLEMVTRNFTDAYFHIRVHEEEQAHCLPPDTSSLTMLPWIHMCFELKAVPLLWYRFGTAVSRLILAMYDTSETRHHLYPNDPILVVAGTMRMRKYLFAMYVLATRLLRIQLTWHKTTRKYELVWRGVKITLDVKVLAVRVALPERTVTDMRKDAAAIKGLAVVSMGRSRTFTGPLCWVSGVLPRVRWIVRVLYAVLTAHERESLQRESTQRRKGRRTTPEDFVHTKRMRLALTWICAV